jgi:maleate isomerase
LGVITPSSNSILEPIISNMLKEANCTAHFTRLPVKNLSLAPSDLEQFRFEPMISAARLLSDVEVDAIVWCGTSGSWLGAKNDEELCKAISDETKTKATTTTLAQLSAFRHYHSKRIGLVVPYNESLTDLIAENYSREGFEMVKKNFLGLISNLDFGRVLEEEIEKMIYESAEDVDSICVLCTNFSVAPRVDKIEQKIGVMLFDSVSVTVWASLQLLGVYQGLKGWGRLLNDNPKFS